MRGRAAALVLGTSSTTSGYCVNDALLNRLELDSVRSIYHAGYWKTTVYSREKHAGERDGLGKHVNIICYSRYYILPPAALN